MIVRSHGTAMPVAEAKSKDTPSTTLATTIGPPEFAATPTLLACVPYGNEAAALQDFLFHPNSHAAAIGVSTGYLETAVDDPRFHFFRIGLAGGGIRATALNSAQWFGKVRRAETKARQSEGGKRNTDNLLRWVQQPTDQSSGSNI